MSKKGLEMRGKRAEYSEGIFGQIKWNIGFKRFLLRGLDKVDLEWGLLYFALNIKRTNKKDIEKLEKNSNGESCFFIKKHNRVFKTKNPTLIELDFLFIGGLFQNTLFVL